MTSFNRLKRESNYGTYFIKYKRYYKTIPNAHSEDHIEEVDAFLDLIIRDYTFILKRN